MTIKASEIFQQSSFEQPSPPNLKDIQSKISHYDMLIQCPPEVNDLLQMLNTKHGLDNINYVCLKVLACHHESFAITHHLEGFGMTVGGFFFPCFKNMMIVGQLNLPLRMTTSKNNVLHQNFLSTMILQGHQVQGQLKLSMPSKRGIAINVQHILKVIVVH